MRRNRLLAVVSVFLVVIALTGGALILFSDETGENGDTDTPTDEATDEVSDLPTAGTSELLPEDEAIEESWGSIRFVVETQGAEEEKRISVFFISDGLNEDVILHDAAECSEQYLAEDYVSASCYGFDSEEALEASDPDPENASMMVICWRAFYSATEDDSSSGTATENQYASRGCPEV